MYIYRKDVNIENIGTHLAYHADLCRASAQILNLNFRGRGNENGSSSVTTGGMAMTYTSNERYLDAFSHNVYFMQINSKTRSPGVRRSQILDTA